MTTSHASSLRTQHLSAATPGSNKLIIEGSQSTLGFWRDVSRNNRHFIAGGIGGVAGAVLTCPLEVVKTQLQSKTIEHNSVRQIFRNIVHNEGIAGFWKGLAPLLAGVVPARSVYFYTYNSSKNFLKARGHTETAPTHLMAAVVAGGATATIINPIWVIKTRLQLQEKSTLNVQALEKQYRGTFHAVRTILKEEGFRGFFKGLIPSYWGISESALHFVLYEAFKQRIATRRPNPETAGNDPETAGNSQELAGKAGGKRAEMQNVELMAAAGLAKFIAATATYPHEVIRTRMRERGAAARYKSAVHCVQRVWVEEGMRGMYAGLGVHLLRVVPNTVIIFLTYEKISALLS